MKEEKYTIVDEIKCIRRKVSQNVNLHVFLYTNVFKTFFQELPTR